jgi:hypothetical protein
MEDPWHGKEDKWHGSTLSTSRGLSSVANWIAVEGRATASGATVGTIVLSEPGAYVVRPLWRDWGGKVEDPDEVGRGFPDPIRLEVVEPGVSVTAEVVEPSISVSAWATLLSAAAALAAGLTAWQLLRRRQHPV